MNHRGACACDNDTGDGAGVLCAIPHDYYANEIRWDMLSQRYAIAAIAIRLICRVWNLMFEIFTTSDVFIPI